MLQYVVTSQFFSYSYCIIYIDLISPGPGTVVLSAQIAKKESLAKQLLVATISEFTVF